MLNIGSTALPFEPQNNDYQFFDVTLHSNTDGSVRDELFFRDGKPYKLKRFEELVLDGSLAWEFSQDQTGYKQVRIPLSNALKDSFPMAAKYDGKILKIVNPDFSLGSDEVYHHSNGYTYLSIADTDSGWPEAWNGTTLSKATYTTLTRDATAVDMIKAYFNGWKWDEANKRWFPINNPASYSSDVDYVTNPSNAGAYPYRLLYQLAQPVEVPVSSEGEISLFEGTNVMEVGTGAVRREATIPVTTNDNGYVINSMDTSLPTNPLSYRVDRFLDVYRGTTADKRWNLKNMFLPYGNYRAYIKAEDYDKAAAYSVTYTVLDKYAYTAPLIDLQAEYRTKLAGVVAENSQDIADLATRVSVIEATKANKQQGQWIPAVLLNGWVNCGGSFATAAYRKDEFGFIHLKGSIKSGAMPSTAFKLPQGYRPKEYLKFPTISSGFVLANVDVSGTGDVYVNNTGTNALITLDGISFLAEQ
ncbi:hypothetical protein P4T20_15780 [Aneurinibacillus thermoaerophilus]|nr:hypothetical protein [Aneurinibacillus thermoaerophilus]